VPVAAVASTVATSAALLRISASTDDVPENVLVPVKVWAVDRLATSDKVLLPKAIVLFVSVVVLAAVTMFVGVMIDDRVAMSYPSALIFAVNACNSASSSSFVGADVTVGVTYASISAISSGVKLTWLISPVLTSHTILCMTIPYS